MNPGCVLLTDRSRCARDASIPVRGLGEWIVLETVHGSDGGASAQAELFNRNDIRVVVLPLSIVPEYIRRESGRIAWIAYGDPRDIIRAFFLGVADYLAEPWTAAEMIARTRRLLTDGAALHTNRLHHEMGAVVVRDDHTAVLSGAETALWGLLRQHEGCVVDRSAIAEVLGLRAPDAGRSRAVDMAVSRLRRALGSERTRIRTVRGRGYILLQGE